MDIHHTGGRIGIQQNGMLGCIQSEGIAREFEIVEEKAIRILNRYDAEIQVVSRLIDGKRLLDIACGSNEVWLVKFNLYLGKDNCLFESYRFKPTKGHQRLGSNNHVLAS